MLMLLVGSDAVRFNRAFAASGLDQRCLRLSTLMDENMLMASGPTATAGLYSTAGFFASLANQDTLDFHGQYARRFGVEAPPLGSLGESCYEGVLLLAALIARARTLDVARSARRPTPSSYEGPRGLLRLRGSHVRQRIYLARADGVDFDVVAQLDLRSQPGLDMYRACVEILPAGSNSECLGRTVNSCEEFRPGHFFRLPGREPEDTAGKVPRNTVETG